MSHARAWRALVLGAGYACGTPGTAEATAPTPAAATRPPEADSTLIRVEVATLGDAKQDPLLFDRIRSLFSGKTEVVPSDDQQLDQRAVLSPRRPDTVYVWIRVTERRAARVYLTLAESGQQARYLFREVRLDSGLDEIGSETLAEVAHSSARALWLHERQSSRETLVVALEREAAEAPQPAPAPASAPIVVAARPLPRADAILPAHEPAGKRRRPRTLRLGIGADGTGHSSGTEGFLTELGGFVGLEYRGQLMLRTAARYVVPAEFGVRPARVQLSGTAAEIRAGWLSADATVLRVRLEAGLGALLGRARATIVDDQPKAHALAAQSFYRGYALAAAGLEWPIGPAWIAASIDVRVPLATTSYEVAGQAGASTSAALSPGGSLEVGIGFDPTSR